jgi:hypothetical protein
MNWPNAPDGALKQFGECGHFFGIERFGGKGSVKWTRRELKLLGNYPDAEVARQTGRTKTAVGKRRNVLRIRGLGLAGRKWTKKEDATAAFNSAGIATTHSKSIAIPFETHIRFIVFKVEIVIVSIIRRWNDRLTDTIYRQGAYELYIKRGQQPGYELEDWLQAEQEVTGRQRRQTSSPM